MDIFSETGKIQVTWRVKKSDFDSFANIDNAVRAYHFLETIRLDSKIKSELPIAREFKIELPITREDLQ